MTMARLRFNVKVKVKVKGGGSVLPDVRNSTFFTNYVMQCNVKRKFIQRVVAKASIYYVISCALARRCVRRGATEASVVTRLDRPRSSIDDSLSSWRYVACDLEL